ncbi:MAG: [protein-PII] uridylyltransferase [Nitrospirae bacterium]|nr:[protein-PII] uridylyltransferase [Candidatus Troglogloeales bacterium]
MANLSDQVSLKEYRESQFRGIRARQQQGATAARTAIGAVAAHQIIASLTALADEILDALYRQVVQQSPLSTQLKIAEGFAIVALGGFGRGELCPYSDIDLMFLYKKPHQAVAEEASKKILHALWDIGFRVGHSVRDLNDCIVLAKSDLTIRTALLESRIVAGNKPLFEHFFSRFYQSVALRNTGSYINAKIREREEECEKHGTTVYLLEPHVKLSQGGLRDIHLFRWLALCRHQTASLETLKDLGVLSKADYQALAGAQEFLWQIRNDLHFTADQCQDVLTFDDQIRLAKLYEFKDKGHLLAVEQFMTRYYEKTTQIRDITAPIIEQMRPRPLPFYMKRIFKRRKLFGDFQMIGDEISILPAAREKIVQHLSEVLRIFHAAQICHIKPSFETYALIKQSPVGANHCAPLPQEGVFFLKIMSVPGEVVWVLRELHRLRLLEKIIPAFAHARALMQFNAYHKYTVDEHSFRAVEEAESLLHVKTQAGEVYREIHKKDILHLALLLHDIGKGEGGDHSEVGVQIADEASEKLGIDKDAKNMLLFLVKQHLLMTHLAFRRDLSDPQVIIEFAKTVATSEMLKMLYILTLSDVAAVGAGTLTDWKRELLGELFQKTLEILTGEQVVQMEKHLDEISPLSNEKARVTAKYDERRKITAYTIYTFDTVTEAIFSKISGVMAAKGLQILGAAIMTGENQVVVDTFHVEDLDFIGEPPENRLENVSHAIREVLLGNLQVETLLIHGSRRRGRIVLKHLPTQVEIDNLSSDRFTIVEVFAEDRQGLLYFITKAIFEAGLSVHTAKISTQLDQIVDVFYVTAGGQKVTDPSEVLKIKGRIISTIDRFLEYNIPLNPPLLRGNLPT